MSFVFYFVLFYCVFQDLFDTEMVRLGTQAGEEREKQNPPFEQGA